MKHSSQRLIMIALLMVVGAGFGRSALARAMAAPESPTGLTITVSAPLGAPLAGAAVRVEPLGLAGKTDAQGRIRFDRIALTDAQPVQIAVDAAGYRPWLLRGAQARPHDVLLVDAPLSPAGPGKPALEVIDVQPDRATSGGVQTPNANPATADPAPNAAYALPASIRVYRVSLGRIDTVAFRDYVKRVLPNEWIPSWNSHSLSAGAVAAKEFAWYNTSIHRKYPLSYGYDVKDTTADQVYNPNVTYASTNAAVDATWDTIIVRNGAPFETQFCAGAANGSRTSGQCHELYGSNFPDGNFMSQNGSQYKASQQEYSWQSILTFYYLNTSLGAISGGGVAAWPVLRSGDSGVKVLALQYLLRQRGAAITADGAFGPGTDQAVRSFQSANGLTADGVAGEQTFAKLVVTVRLNDQNEAVRAIQVLLSIQNTGLFGSTTDSVVRQFQQSHRLAVDGIVGSQTWQAAFGQ